MVHENNLKQRPPRPREQQAYLRSKATSATAAVEMGGGGRTLRIFPCSRQMSACQGRFCVRGQQIVGRLVLKRSPPCCLKLYGTPRE